MSRRIDSNLPFDVVLYCGPYGVQMASITDNNGVQWEMDAFEWMAYLTALVADCQADLFRVHAESMIARGTKNEKDC